MIEADVEVVDLDPAQWAVLNELVLEARRFRKWGYVLHNDAHVLTRYPDKLDVVPGDPVGDPQALAERLLMSADVDRVVVIDRHGLPAIARAAAVLVAPGGPLTRYREEVEELYWTSPAVATAPAPPANPWRATRALAEAVGAGTVHLCVYDQACSAAPVTAIALTVARGSVVRISSPAAETADVVLALTASDLVAAMRSSDLVGRLVACARDDVRSRGLSRLPTLAAAVTSPSD